MTMGTVVAAALLAAGVAAPAAAQAPSVAGGLVAKVADELDLGYRIPLAAVPR